MNSNTNHTATEIQKKIDRTSEQIGAAKIVGAYDYSRILSYRRAGLRAYLTRLNRIASRAESA